MSGVYQASPVTRRRATRAEVEARRDPLREIVSGMHPMTVRQAFYQATVLGLVEKTEERRTLSHLVGCIGADE